MIDENRWTVRNVSKQARDMVDEVHELTGVSYGRLLTEAIDHWFQDLPDGDPCPSFRWSSEELE